MKFKSFFCFGIFIPAFLISKTKIISTIGANGASTYSGDNGPAINASVTEDKGIYPLRVFMSYKVYSPIILKQ